MTDLAKTSVSKLSVCTFYDAKTRSSFCWKYFGNLIVTDSNKKKKINCDHVYCLACLSAVKNESEDVTFGSVKVKCYNKTVSTGNLTRHLRDDHHIQDEPSSADAAADNAKTNISDTKDFFTVTRPSKTSSKCCTRESSSRSNKGFLARDLVLWFCKSLIPFDSVSDEGMVDFFKKYDVITGDDDIPSRNTIIGSALSHVYESMLNKVKENISMDTALHFSLTFDLWTDQFRRLNYITFTLHYLNSDFILKALTLGTEMVNGKETEEKIKDVIEEIKERFALDNKKIVAVTGAPENVKRATSLVNMTHHLCLGHGLHKLVSIDGIKSLPEIPAVVQKCKEILKSMRYQASELQADAEKVQIQLEFLNSLDRVVEAVEDDEGNPISEDEMSKLNKFEDLVSASVSRSTPTRWYSVLEMLQSLIHVCDRDLINNMLAQIDQCQLTITQTEWNLLEDLVKLLESFREAVEILSSQKTCTLNVALVFRSEIIDLLNTPQDDKSLIMFRLKQNMLAEIDNRFPVTKAIVAAALLDNRFLSLKEVDVFLENQNTTRTTFLSSYIKEVIGVNNMPERKTLNTTSNSSDNDNSLLHRLSKKHSNADVYKGIQDDPIEQECWRYITSVDPTEPKDGDLLSYWNSKKEAFPYLSALAKALLCVPATSIPSERVFSKVGLTVTAKRSRLSPVRVNKIIFIHDNYKIFKP